jgi:alpha-maltose-1-phosphate synthase
VNALVADPARAADMGRTGRDRAVVDFGWDAVARTTLDVYESVR